MLTKEELSIYLKRLGLADISHPDLETLAALHRAHVQLIPWHTIDIVAGKPAPINQAIQLMTSERSGYCFHLNSAFGELLRSLGYQVMWHRAGVQRLGQESEPHINGFHLTLTVILPDDKLRNRYIVDVGLGDMPFEPLPLQQGAYIQGPYTYQVAPSTFIANGWRLHHDPLASFAGVEVDPEVLSNLGEFEPKHHIYSSSSDSPWINLVIVRQRHASGSNELKGCMWRKRELASVEDVELTSKREWLTVLGDVFQERLVHYSKLEQDELWRKIWRNHEEWKRSLESKSF